MSISSPSATDTTQVLTQTGTSGTSLSSNNSVLGKDDFLKLMMVQLQNQDPTQPSDPTQYLGELAQFTTLEQETNIAQSTQTSTTEQATTSALSLIGKTVSYTDGSGNTVTGGVQKVDLTSAGPTLTVDGISNIAPSSVTEVS